MDQSQKGMPSKRAKRNPKIEQEIMGDLAKCILEVLKTSLQQDQEPFEHYAHRLTKRLQKGQKVFSNRFIQGYEVLLEQLESIHK
jgi:hypothetical protein